MNIGIVIGVSEYVNADRLEGCKNDASIIYKALSMSGKYDDVLYITEDTNSRAVKSKISAFVERHKKSDVSELFYYFTGHGSFDEDEFYYILSDYVGSRKKQTSLENSELDRWLKSLEARLTIKVVDACQSGTSYIKDPDVFQKYLQSSEDGFGHCYFMYSSHNSQYSWQHGDISDFTLSFVRGLVGRPGQDVRYKDIIDTISDEFASSSKQTPLFVSQATYTEVFAHVTSEMADVLKEMIGSEVREESKPADHEKSLLQLISADAESYCTREEALACVEAAWEQFGAYTESSEFGDIYSLSKESLPGLPSLSFNTDFLGNFVSKSNVNYFADVNYETRTRRVRKSGSILGLIAGFGGEDVPMVDETYQAPSGAKSSIELPHNVIYVRCIANYPNINDTGCFVFPFVSQTKIAFAYVMFFYRVREWEVKEIDRSTCEWGVVEQFINGKNGNGDFATGLMDRLVDFTMKPINKVFGSSEEQE